MTGGLNCLWVIYIDSAFFLRQFYTGVNPRVLNIGITLTLVYFTLSVTGALPHVDTLGHYSPKTRLT